MRCTFTAGSTGGYGQGGYQQCGKRTSRASKRRMCPHVARVARERLKGCSGIAIWGLTFPSPSPKATWRYLAIRPATRRGPTNHSRFIGRFSSRSEPWPAADMDIGLTRLRAHRGRWRETRRRHCRRRFVRAEGANRPNSEVGTPSLQRLVVHCRAVLQIHRVVNRVAATDNLG